MANDKKSNDGGKNDKKNGEVKVPARGWILLMAVIAFIPLLMMVRNQAETKYHSLKPNEFLQKVDDNQILAGTITFNPQSPQVQEITGKYVEVDETSKRSVETPFKIK